MKIGKFKLIDSISAVVGSWWFLIFHMIWFVLWLFFKVDISLLIMVVSLEAIILMILLLMDQNRQATRDDLRDEEDLQVDLKAVDLGEEILKEVKDIKERLDKLEK
jgi:uncharacterized membrane protein